MVKAFSSGLSSVLSGGADTIVARATAAGASALAVIRVSGPETCRLAGLLSPDINMASPWRAGVVRLHDESGVFLEEAIIIPYRAPRSYTGEDMLELMVHGSRWIVDAVVGTIISAGARQAAPGEFTRRAVANGKMDLVQAEAVNEVIQAETEWQARMAREQLHGVLSQEFRALKDALVALLAEVEGSLDFEEQGVVVDQGAHEAARKGCVARIDTLLVTVGAGVRVREGARVVIVGKPNAGKSTLFNTLLARERAIVAPTPGTTRDVLEAELEIEGLPVILVDTAGLREAEDPTEAEGVRRARREEERADLIVALWDVEDYNTLCFHEFKNTGRRLDIVSKADLAEQQIEGVLAISCLTGQGVDQLLEEIHLRVAAPVAAMEGSVAVNLRQAEALLRARKCLETLISVPQEVAALEIRSAMLALHEILGSLDDNEVLDAVFSSFCVGK